MYSNDSFFSLSTLGSVGLAILSLLLVLGLGWLCWRVMRGRSILTRIAIALVAFVAFVWLSPQIYYTYYMLLFEGLPVQWVGHWPDVSVLIETVTFQGRATLSDHSKGVLFWALVSLALAPRVLRR